MHWSDFLENFNESQTTKSWLMSWLSQEYEAYNIKLEKQTVIHQIELPPEGTIHVVVAMPFLDVNPLAGEK